MLTFVYCVRLREKMETPSNPLFEVVVLVTAAARLVLLAGVERNARADIARG